MNAQTPNEAEGPKPLDLSEKGLSQGQVTSLDRRLFMKFTGFGGCKDPRAAAAALVTEDGVHLYPVLHVHHPAGFADGGFARIELDLDVLHFGPENLVINDIHAHAVSPFQEGLRLFIGLQQQGCMLSNCSQDGDGI
jgi:hypothetical protein